jgi:hypothetical protein
LAKTTAGQLEVLRPKLGTVAWGAIGFAIGHAIVELVHQFFIVRPFMEHRLILYGVCGAIGGLCLGIATKRRVLALLLAGAVGFAAAILFGLLGIAGLVIGYAIAGAVLGLALGYRWKALALAAAGSLAFAFFILAMHFGIDPFESIEAIAGQMFASVITYAIWGGVIGAAFGLVIDLIEQRRTTP